MRQAVLLAPKTIELRDRDPASLLAADVRVEVSACGVCGSDIGSYLHGHYVEPGQVMGHELTGTVVEAGPEVGHLRPGQRVVARPLRTCGACWYCRRGEGHLCATTNRDSIGYGADGAYADELVVRGEAAHRQLVPVPGDIAPEDAMWAEPLAVCLHALARADVGPGARVLVTGAGPIGLGVTAAAVAGGMDVEVVEPRARRREAALAVGATAAHAPGDAPASEVDALLDASGVPAAIAAASGRVVPGGTVVLLGLGDVPLEGLAPAVRVRGSFAFTPQDFTRAVRLIASGAVRLGSAVSHRFALEDLAQAIETAAGDPAAVKVAVLPRLGQDMDNGDPV